MQEVDNNQGDSGESQGGDDTPTDNQDGGDDTPADNPDVVDTPTDSSVAAVVNCENMVPCTWNAADGGFSIEFTNFDQNTVSNAQNLVSYFSVDTTRDTAIEVRRQGSALYEDGEAFTFNSSQVGGTSFGPHDFIAGFRVNGELTFDQEPRAGRTTLSRYSMQVQERGNDAQDVVLLNVPVGRAVSQDEDCANVLPCTWVSGDGEISVTITEFFENTQFSNLTEYRLEITATRDMFVERDINNRNTLIADTNQALSYNGNFSFNVDAAIRGNNTHDALAGVTFNADGQFNFLDAGANSLQRFQMSLFESPSLPRFDPVFLNVPVSR